MTLRFADPGGEYYISRSLSQAIAEGLWSNIAQMSFVSTAPAGRSTTYALSSTGGSGVFATGALHGNFGACIAGWANYNSGGTFTNNSRIFSWFNGANGQTDLRTDASGHVFFTRNGTAIGGSSTNVLGTGWHYFEVKTVFATGATGSAEFRVDGVVWLTITSVQTANTVATADSFAILATVLNVQQYYKDIYALDTGTGTLTGYQGDITVNTVYAAVAGPSQQWTASSGTQVSCVDDGASHTGTIPDDTDYISDSTSGHISDFQFQSVTVPGGGSILAAVHVSRVSKEVGSVVNLQQYTKSGGTTHTSASVTLGTSPAYVFDILENDPNTGSPWTQTNLNNSTHGAKIP